MSYVVRINWVVLLLTGVAVYGHIQWQSLEVHQLLIDMILFTGMMILQAVFLLKIRALYGFSLVLLYTLALMTGLRIMLSIDQLLSLAGMAFFILELVLIMYFIGVRGFLRSDKGRLAMGLEANPPEVNR